MRRDDLIQVFAQAFERAADRLRAERYDDPWPDDLWPREIIRLLRERWSTVIAALREKGGAS